MMRMPQIWTMNFSLAAWQICAQKNFDFAVINPPFSLQLESPNLIDFGCNSFGPFGKGTSALSHEYALEHALNSARFVAAVLPASMEAYCRSKERLIHIVHLPQAAFFL